MKGSRSGQKLIIKSLNPRLGGRGGASTPGTYFYCPYLLFICQSNIKLNSESTEELYSQSNSFFFRLSSTLNSFEEIKKSGSLKADENTPPNPQRPDVASKTPEVGQKLPLVKTPEMGTKTDFCHISPQSFLENSLSGNTKADCTPEVGRYVMSNQVSCLYVRPKQKNCLRFHGQKKLGSVGQHLFFF